MNEIYNMLSKIQADFIDFLPQLATALLISIVGIFAAYLLKWLSTTMAMWLSKIIPKNIKQKFLTEKDVTIFSRVLGKIVFYITIFLTIASALKKLGLDIVSTWFASLASYLPNIVAALIIFIFGWKLKDFFEEVLYRSLSQINFNQAKAVSKLTSWTIFILSAIIALEQIGLNVELIINIATMLSGIVLGGIALTFALGAKSNISDILACFQMHRLLKVGEQIKVADQLGIVKSIGPVYIIIETPENKIALPGSYFNKNIMTIQKKKV